MSETMAKLRKKRGAAVEVEGDTFHVRSLTLGELRRVDALPNEEKTGFVIGCTLCSGPDGEPEFPKQSDETDSAWAKRITEQLGDVSTDKIRLLSERVASLGKVPKTSDIVKN
jgi:hypothetical protein